MSPTLRPHDLLWLTDREALETTSNLPPDLLWQPTLPVVVRRDWRHDGAIPVGVRGPQRQQRIAGWVHPNHIVRQVTPENLADPALIQRSALSSLPPLQAALQLIRQIWPWQWGITGSTGYALATGLAVLHTDSDLDLLIRAARKPDQTALHAWQNAILSLPCRIDTQVETPAGGFALAEWLRDGRTLLKTRRGPVLVRDPWQTEA